jgi:hypothetical protein
MRAFTTVPAAARRRPGNGLFCLVASGLLWGTGGLTGSLLGRTAGLSAISVAAYRLAVGGVLIVVFLTVTGRRWPAGRAAVARRQGGARLQGGGVAPGRTRLQGGDRKSSMPGVSTPRPAPSG